jgi:hypothetical protein
VAAETLHIVQAFRESGDGIMALPPRTFGSAAVARSVAQIMAHSHVGVVAWSRSFDPDAGEYGEPEELARLGTIPVVRRGRRRRVALALRAVAAERNVDGPFIECRKDVCFEKSSKTARKSCSFLLTG